MPGSAIFPAIWGLVKFLGIGWSSPMESSSESKLVSMAIRSPWLHTGNLLISRGGSFKTSVFA